MGNDALRRKKMKLRKDFKDAGFDLDKKVDFWGQRISLKRAIGKMDRDDIADAYNLIANWKEAGFDKKLNKVM
jgi:hypothetical protein